jgi:glycosyltransferase involved in cell wall biosynthesis
MKVGNKPKVEILLATFNGEKYIGELLDSILNQTYKNIKITIHDDGSSDRTLEILRDYSKRYPEIINLIDDGISIGSVVRNFEFLLKNSLEDYIMFADQDDVWLPNKIELTLKKMLELEDKYGKDTPLLIYTDVKVVDENLNILSESLWDYNKVDGRNRTFSKCLEIGSGQGFTMMINKKSKELSLPFPQNVIMHDYWVSLVVSAFGEIEYIDITTGLYRQHSKNVLGAKKFDINTLKEKILNFQEELSRFKEDRKVRQNQARDFFEMYGNFLPNNLKEIILFYINAQKTNRFVRIFKVLKFGLLWFKSPLRNLCKLFLRWFLL